MEKRFALFLVLSALVLFVHLMLQQRFAPPKPAEDGGLDEVGVAPVDEQDEAAAEAPAAEDTDQAKPDKPAEEPGAEPGAEPDAKKPAKEPGDPAVSAAPRPKIPDRRGALGSMAEDSPFRLLVTWNSRGAAIERIELPQQTGQGKFRYRELDVKNGYLGHLALSDEPDGTGCRVNVVGPGTPAATAEPKDGNGEPGLQVGDVIVKIGGQDVRDVVEYDVHLAATQPGQSLEVTVRRYDPAGATVTKNFNVALTQQPLSIVQPEVNQDSALGLQDPLSFLLTLETIGDKAISRGSDELAIPSLKDGNWEVTEFEDDGSGPGVEFRFRLNESDLTEIGLSGALEIIKRYRLARIPADQLDNEDSRSYHLTMDVEIHNAGTSSLKVGYRLDGPNGLPLEGWWYSNKIHPGWSSAGARDVVWRTPSSRHGLKGCSAIYSEAKEAEEKGQAPMMPLFADGKPQALEYVGVDTQYFAVVLKPDEADGAPASLFKQALAVPAGDIGEKKKSRIKTTNVTFRLTSQPEPIPAGKASKQSFVIFAGPKKPELLAEYGLEDCIVYGWFAMVAKPLLKILHGFEWLPFVNFGLAIIMLTVLVRSCMIPLSRKATRNAQMMQELAPEMKRIAEQYKNDMEKRGTAQRELFAKHNYNPFGGCLLMFVQLPIFIGLYRSLSVDVELRQASLIPGLRWCSNLAGPDMLFYWKDWVPDFLANESGWLGPYFNILPIITIFLFLLQQKMFMPPATDDQTRMQQKVMKFMMIFMGFLFFRVASGLCVYFIASSLWGVAERKLLPPPGKGGKDSQPKPNPKRVADVEARRAKAKKKQKKR